MTNQEEEWHLLRKDMRIKVLLLIIFVAGMFPASVAQVKQNKKLLDRIVSADGIVALWDFRESKGNPRISIVGDTYPLKEANGPVSRVDEGPLSGRSASFDGETYLSLPNHETGRLNIHGQNRGVTVMAWIRWGARKNSFIAGMWNEYQDGGKRQYGLFASLPHYNGDQQVCGHISKTGKPTPPFPYSIDYSASPQLIPVNEWCCVAFTYDGRFIRSYLNGEFEAREPELISHTKGFEGYPDGLVQSKNPYYFPDGMGNNGSDFTVGAVLLKSGMGNFFTGLIGGVAVFDRALSDREIREICSAPDVD